MIETIIPHINQTPFLFNKIDSILISDSPLVIDLFFLEEFNGLVLKNFNCFTVMPIKSFQNYVEILDKKDLEKFRDFDFTENFSEILLELLSGLSSTLLGIQVTGPKKEMCPNLHVDKLPLRLVQCIDEVGTTLVTDKGTILKTEKNDLIFLKGEMWKSTPGALKHKSPHSSNFRTLLRIDFLD